MEHRRLRLRWPGLHHPAFWPPTPWAGLGTPLPGARITRQEEAEYVEEYIALLKDELEAAEEHLKELIEEE